MHYLLYHGMDHFSGVQFWIKPGNFREFFVVVKITTNIRVFAYASLIRVKHKSRKKHKFLGLLKQSLIK